MSATTCTAAPTMTGQITWPKLSFSFTRIPSSTSSPRLGHLVFNYASSEKKESNASSRPPREVATPAVMAYTRKGSIPHLTRDNVARLPNEMIHLSLEHFLDMTPPIFSQAPISLHRFIGLHDTATYRQPVIALGLRDCSLEKKVPPSQDKLIMASTLIGTTKVSPEKMYEYLLSKPSEIVISPSDEVSGPVSSKKVEKIIRRGLQWASEFIQVSKGRANIFIPLVGGESVTNREEFSKALLGTTETRATQSAKLDPNQPPLDEFISGYALTIDSTSSNHIDICRASLGPLPVTKPRLTLGASGPHAILRLIQDVGLDLFVDEWSSHLSTIGVALDFTFPAPADGEEFSSGSATPLKPGGKISIGHDLSQPCHDRAFVPLSTSTLGPSLTEPHAFGPIPPTRAYVHHLLKAREMTSYVILAQHNLIVMHHFFENIRQVLSKGEEEFARVCNRFTEVYEDQVREDSRGRGYRVVIDATEEFERVNKERGKGSLRAKLAKDAEVVEVIAKVAPMDSKVVVDQAQQAAISTELGVV